MQVQLINVTAKVQKQRERKKREAIQHNQHKNAQKPRPKAMSKTGKVQALRGNTILGKDTQTHDKEKLEIFSAQQNKTKTTEIISERKKKKRGRRGTMEQNKKKGRKNKNRK